MPPDVPAAVRTLLAATTRLQDTLVAWSTNSASDDAVSDAFVLVGTCFNDTVTAFAHHGIDLSDIHTVPVELRAVLEQCLSEDASPEVLDAYMPGVRAVLVRLLQGLRARQAEWKAVADERRRF